MDESVSVGGVGVIAEAHKIVNEDRQRAYGHPRDNHSTTAAMWSAYLSRRLRLPVALTARDVCHCMSLMKISRDAHLPHRDNLVDVIGWAANVEMAEQQVEPSTSENGDRPTGNGAARVYPGLNDHHTPREVADGRVEREPTTARVAP